MADILTFWLSLPPWGWLLVIAIEIAFIGGCFWALPKLNQAQTSVFQLQRENLIVLRKAHQELHKLNRTLPQVEKAFDDAVVKLLGGWKGKLIWKAIIQGCKGRSKKPS